MPRADELRVLLARGEDEPSPCRWGGGNDVIWCSTCHAEYAYAKGETRPECPRALTRAALIAREEDHDR